MTTHINSTLCRKSLIALGLVLALLAPVVSFAAEPSKPAPPAASAPQKQVPQATSGLSGPPAEIRLRTGDVLALSLPGEPVLTKDLQVDRDGALLLPEIGLVKVAGLSMEDADRLIRQQLGTVFRDLERLTIVIKERRLPVTVLGFVKTPGPVELPADATVQMAIMAAGGLSQGAQLDRMQMRRDGNVVTFDYKKYLDTGDATLLPSLKPLDTVFVPASPLTGNVQIDFDGRTLAQAGDGAEDRTAVKIFGEVNTPAVYAWRDGASVVDMLLRAGGVTRYAAVEQIRIITDGNPTVFNLQDYLDSGDIKSLPPLTPGATVFVPKQVEEVRRGALTVYVMGEVAKPGAFETKEGATFIDILANAGGPTRFADTKQIRLLKANGGVVMVDLPAYTENPGSVTLPSIRPGDALFVPEKMDTDEPSWLKIPTSRAVEVMGAVNKPGRYEWADEMTLFDLLAHAGGPTAKADTSAVRILAKRGDEAHSQRFDLGSFLDKGGRLDQVPKIRAGYVIVVPELPQDPNENKSAWVRQAPDQSIYLMGQVGAPGRYAFNESLGFLDILTAANGPSSSADIRRIRVSHRGEAGARVTHVNLSLYFETGDESLLPKVRPGDVIYIPDRNGDWLDQPKERTVRVLGSVAKPGRYRFSDDMTLLDLLAEAGGPTDNAYQSKIVVVNLSCCRDEARLFDLIGFAKSGRFDDLPVVREGDTIYVPSIEQSNWKIFMTGVRDIVSILSVVALI